MVRPLGAQPVGTGQGAVTAADDKGVDAVADEVEGGFAATFDLAEGGAASSADKGTANGSEPTDVVPADLCVCTS